jgi:polyphosphate kinase
MPTTKTPMLPKELSWLSFNARVLQEAADHDVPVIERVRYLGIFSNNMDEFFRVHVADLRRLAVFSSSTEKAAGIEMLDAINQRVIELQQRYDSVYSDLVKVLRKRNIYLVNEGQLTSNQALWVERFFRESVLPILQPVLMGDQVGAPQLNDASIYFAIKLHLASGQTRYALMEIPTPPLQRFIVLPPKAKRKKAVIVLDNIIRRCLPEVFRGALDITKAEAYTFKLTRDAELELGEGITQSLIDKVTQSLKRRQVADPVRFVYDAEMPKDLVDYLSRIFSLGKLDSLIAGGRYHNAKDFMRFPNLGPTYLEFEELPVINVPALDPARNTFSALQKQDVLLYYPYHDFRHVADLLYTAALDPQVKSISMTLYRVASDSHIANALINAANNKKKVLVVVELQARFDEQANIRWAQRLTEAGVRVIFGIAGLKVHAKLILVERTEGGSVRYYSHIGTGNFNEKTARVYTDLSLLTSNQDIGREVAKVFDYIQYTYHRHEYKHLMVSPEGTRSGILALIRQEINNARLGRAASIVFKCNNLVDTDVIASLYEADQAGVTVRLIVRGMCALVPGIAGVSENIEVISIVDRLLEHARVFVFGNNGHPKVYISSADLMTRNLDFRIEVTCPIHDPTLRRFVLAILDLQLADNMKARLLDGEMKNQLRPRKGNRRKVRSQEELVALVQEYTLGKRPGKE